MEENIDIFALVLQELNSHDMWFTTKKDPTMAEASSYYKLDAYGDPVEATVNKVSKEVSNLIGDGAVDIYDAVDLWINDALVANKIDFKDNLVTQFEVKPVVDGIEAYENPVQFPQSKKVESVQVAPVEKKEEYYTKPEDENIIWDSDDTNEYDIEEMKAMYQEYVDNFNDKEKPMTYEDWLESDECVNYFDAEWSYAAKDSDEYDDWGSFINDYVTDDEKKTAYAEYVDECNNTRMEPEDFDKWLEDYKEVNWDGIYADKEADLSDNILASVDGQLHSNVLLLSGVYDSNYPDFKSSGNGGVLFTDGADEFRDYMGGFDRVCITSTNGVLGAICGDHDGTVAGHFYTLPEDITELLKAMNYSDRVKEAYDEEQIDKYGEVDLMETEFEDDLMYGGVDANDLISHIDLLVPIKDTVSDNTVSKQESKKVTATNTNVSELLDLLDKVNITNKQRAFCEFTGISKAQLNGSQGFNEENAKIFIPKVKEWLSKQESVNVSNCTNIKKVEAVEYISKQDYDKLPAEYKTTISKTLKARQVVGDNVEELRKLYKELGYNEEDPMVLANDNGTTVLKPVKVQESIQATADLVTKYKNALKTGEDLTNLKSELETAIADANKEEDNASVQLLTSILNLVRAKVVDKDVERENKQVNFKRCTKENYQRRLDEVNNKSKNIISDMFSDNSFDSDTPAGQIVMRTSEMFNALSDKGYDVDVTFDNGESTSAIQLGKQGGKVMITITDTNQPLRAFTSGNFEVTEDNLKILQDIQNEIKSL